MPDFLSTPSCATEIFAKKQGTIHAPMATYRFPSRYYRSYTHALSCPVCRPASPSFLFIVRPGPGTWLSTVHPL
ncbi:hypothetical protein CORC01_05164 [Colletotrichum orchidophilum]|uniref:Uncharacterized protein n=1 Tax=Colletotrichum orchidophilum TaxID=1209926 RepID=A0A1G4BE43_9PEZI|nr:uncharacterized protein CORC01_05164 [Colletotrichum orchidophilum]OHE99586.1 hypothetical protein CORC01_05164 [Colletotrichum orchidophilum]